MKTLSQIGTSARANPTRSRRGGLALAGACMAVSLCLAAPAETRAGSGIGFDPAGHLTFYMDLGDRGPDSDVGVRFDVMNGHKRIITLDMAPDASSPSLYLKKRDGQSWRARYHALSNEPSGARSHVAPAAASASEPTPTRSTVRRPLSAAQQHYMDLLALYLEASSPEEQRALYPRLIAAHGAATAR